MLSELCVRRPVFATMLVMSLVVLGIFSFRDLGVDLFPKADPATVNVALSLPGASPDEMSSSVDRADGGGAQRHLRHRRDSGAHRRRAAATITVRFVLERDINDAAQRRAREGRRARSGTCRRELLPPVITKVDPDADPVMSLIVSSDDDEPADADRDRRQADRARDRDGQRRRRGDASRGGRAREIHIVVDIEKLNSYGLSMTQVRDAVVAENVEIPGGTVEQGKGQLLLRTLGRVDATERLQQHRRRDQERHADPRVGHRLRRGQLRAADQRRCGWATTPAVHARHPPRDGREHGRGDRRRARASSRRSSGRCRQSVKMTVIRDDSQFIYASIASLEEHLIFGSLLRDASS